MTTETTSNAPGTLSLAEYQQAVERWCALPNSISNGVERMQLALLGLQEELGEIAGPIKKLLWHGHTFDLIHMEEEIGDLLWYLAMLCNTLDLSLTDVLARNLDKLQARYPEGFSQERSQQRASPGH